MISNSSCLSAGNPKGMPLFGCFSKYPPSSSVFWEQVRSSASDLYSPTLFVFFILWESSSIIMESFNPQDALLSVTLKNSFCRHSPVDWASVKRRVGSMDLRRELL